MVKIRIFLEFQALLSVSLFKVSKRSEGFKKVIAEFWCKVKVFSQLRFCTKIHNPHCNIIYVKANLKMSCQTHKETVTFIKKPIWLSDQLMC